MISETKGFDSEEYAKAMDKAKKAQKEEERRMKDMIRENETLKKEGRRDKLGHRSHNPAKVRYRPKPS
jgi:hypothetical protein